MGDRSRVEFCISLCQHGRARSGHSISFDGSCGRSFGVCDDFCWRQSPGICRGYGKRSIVSYDLLSGSIFGKLDCSCSGQQCPSCAGDNYHTTFFVWRTNDTRSRPCQVHPASPQRIRRWCWTRDATARKSSCHVHSANEPSSAQMSIRNVLWSNHVVNEILAPIFYK